jgi:hypothetical protein
MATRVSVGRDGRGAPHVECNEAPHGVSGPGKGCVQRGPHHKLVVAAARSNAPDVREDVRNSVRDGPARSTTMVTGNEPPLDVALLAQLRRRAASGRDVANGGLQALGRRLRKHVANALH